MKPSPETDAGGGYGAKEVSQMLGLSVAQVRAWVRSGLLDPERGPRGELKFSSEDLTLLRQASGLAGSRIGPRRIERALTRLREQIPSSGSLADLEIEADGNRIIVTSYPVVGRRWQLASEGAEPLWLTSNTVLYRSGISWFQVQIDPASGEPSGPGRLWARDPRFSDTSGWSNRPSHDGGIIYVQGPAETSVGYLRVIPNWVAQMKAAVDAAN